MTPGPWEPAPAEPPTVLAHALALSALHGTDPWPRGGFPLPDEPPARPPVRFPSVALDGVATHHVRPRGDGDPGALADAIAAAAGGNGPAGLHDRLAAQRAVGIVDDLLDEVGRRDLPRESLRRLSRELCETGSRREAVKLAIALLGTVADERDRDLFLLLGALEEFTLFAAVALRRSQPDPDRAVFALAQRVRGWGRIHAVERLRGCTDPDVRAWLLRDGFRNDVMDEYLAHLAATTGGLYEALLEPSVDDALLDGAGDILAALAMGGPAEDLRHYTDALPALHRYLDHVDTATPTLDRLSPLLRIRRILRRPYEGLPWSDDDRLRVVGRLDALLGRPAWADVARERLADPRGPYGFDHALSCARGLGLPIRAAAVEHLEREPLAAYVWQTVLDDAEAQADEAGFAELVALAERLLPLSEVATGPADDLGRAADWALQTVVQQLRDHPGAGLPLLRAALAGPAAGCRSQAVAALEAWPRADVPPAAVGWLRDAERAEPRADLKERMAATLTRWH
ncbi:hypothetical protein [Jiangella endophytica]|uniref:hypothetical protein n=1 Tax=Jiangella endophytica TaxID=1623398 RepID=UPI000E34C06C|nr:hypothetical protein [Jiangella endophytica]